MACGYCVNNLYTKYLFAKKITKKLLFINKSYKIPVYFSKNLLYN